MGIPTFHKDLDYFEEFICIDYFCRRPPSSIVKI